MNVLEDNPDDLLQEKLDEIKKYLTENPIYSSIKKWDLDTLNEVSHRIMMKTVIGSDNKVKSGLTEGGDIGKTIASTLLLINEIISEMKEEYVRNDEITTAYSNKSIGGESNGK